MLLFVHCLLLFPLFVWALCLVLAGSFYIRLDCGISCVYSLAFLVNTVLIFLITRNILLAKYHIMRTVLEIVT